MNQNILDSLLDADLDQWADLPEFVVPPAGAYNAIILDVVQKDINGSPAFEVKVKLNEVLELANATDAAPAPGLETACAYLLTNEFGVGGMKELLKPFKAHFGTTTARETIEVMKGATVLLVTKVRKDKNDPDKKYFQIHKVEIA